jgi:hypothetical protein
MQIAPRNWVGVSMMPVILRFMPLLDRRLSIEIQSGRAAKVVPAPATRPTISDR